jgi:hypothetical protein
MSSSYTPPPPPSLNGGLYTGAPFQKGAPWGNVPVAPDAGVYNFTNLPPSAPALARYMLPGGGFRPGNSSPMIPEAFARSRADGLNMLCIPETPRNQAGAAPPVTGPGCAGAAYRGFGYLL